MYEAMALYFVATGAFMLGLLVLIALVVMSIRSDNMKYNDKKLELLHRIANATEATQMRVK